MLLLAVSGCQHEDIWNELREHEQRIEQLEKQCRELNSNVEAIQAILTAIQENDYVTEIMKIMENGRQQVVTPLPIAEQAIFQGNPIQELVNSHHNMLMQQQVAHLAEMLQDTYKVVKQIKQGQRDDRVGFLKAGRNGLVIAMSLPEGDERNSQIEFSRQNLFVGPAQIAEALKRSVEAFILNISATSVME